ncbi:hypothetical protein BT96DRAFT_947853 [Gymnopus androsaceus JB14]|uniref:Uncharacterized protein n=1 Tax=Gymnopus androsaceus JB14 TaxID=1447944 RepID=A0A6A4GQQ5_9AGAR|nr:hypothetical protein BT96DRAFT_947853 [Gymnopus androsaceus JB14]
MQFLNWNEGSGRIESVPKKRNGKNSRRVQPRNLNKLIHQGTSLTYLSELQNPSGSAKINLLHTSTAAQRRRKDTEKQQESGKIWQGPGNFQSSRYSQILPDIPIFSSHPYIQFSKSLVKLAREFVVVNAVNNVFTFLGITSSGSERWRNWMSMGRSSSGIRWKMAHYSEISRAELLAQEQYAGVLACNASFAAANMGMV